MSIKREFIQTADIQSFAVSAGSILVPFAEEASIRVFGKAAGYDKGFVDTENNTILALPVDAYKLLKRRGLLQVQGNQNVIDDKDVFDQLDTVNPNAVTDKAREVMKRVLLKKNLVQVQLQNPISQSIEELNSGRWYIRIISDRQYPYLGDIFPAGSQARASLVTVPQYLTASKSSSSVPEAAGFSENDRSVREIRNIRESFFREFNRLAAGEQNLNTVNDGPFFKDPEKTVYIEAHGHIAIDPEKQQAQIFTSKSQDAKIAYDGQSDQYKNEARQRLYGDPMAIYRKNNLAENAQQELTHSTFMTPVPRFSTNPLQGLMEASEQMPQILQQFGPIVGIV